MLAAFGQHIFGREDIIRIASEVRENGPRHLNVAMHKTDAALAQLVTEAGTENPDDSTCHYEDLAWVISVNTTNL